MNNQIVGIKELFTFFFFQEGDTTVSLNGETKKISKDDVLLIPLGAKWVT